jgi:hypothetical protein
VLLVGGAAAVLSVSGLAVSGDGVTGRGIAVATGGLVVALGLLWGLVVVERRAGPDGGRVLPAATFRRGGGLGAVYVLVGVLVGVSAVEVFVPLFGQRLGGLDPVVAGFLGVALACGWVTGEVVSASVGRARACVTIGPAVTVLAFAVLTLTQSAAASPVTVLVWAVALAAAGSGVGVAWPHLSAGAMAAGSEDTDGPDGEGDRASAAITMVQMLAVALGASFAGVAVALGTDTLGSARLLYGGLGVVAVLGVLAAVRARRAV